MHYGKCRLVEEKHTLLDKAKLLYQEKLLEGSSAQPFIPGPIVSEPSLGVLPEGWALKSSKKASRFNSNQKNYLDSKFQIGQQTGSKAEPEQVAKEMRHAKNEDGGRRFSVDEFLTPQQIKSYFSRTAAKVRQRGPGDTDESAIEDQAAYSSTRALVLQECQLIHPITYDSYNICDMCARNKLSKLSISMLRLICSHFDVNTDTLPAGRKAPRKAPYVDLISDLVKSCSCNSL